MPNSFAYLVLLVWPLVVVFLLQRFKLGLGSLLSLISAYMFLPAAMSIDFWMIPPLDKFSLTTITIIFYFLAKKESFGFDVLPRNYRVIIATAFFVPFMNALLNSNSYLHLPGLSLYDGLTSSVNEFLYFFPFLIGAKFFKDQRSHKKLFQYFALASLVYAFLALYEIRLSPQLHSMLYGYFPHSWLQQKREGGFRAVLFMGHGLLVGMFLSIGLGCWLAIKKAGVKISRINTTLCVILLIITLIYMKTFSAIIYAVIASLAITYFSKRKQILISVMVASLFITYPLLSATGLFPHKEIVSLVQNISSERAASLEYRFDNESALLEHANEKAFFGWGGWGRNRVFDVDTGQDISVTDGYWIIVLGTYGWIGFLGKFLFFFLPIWFVFRKYKSMHFESEESRVLLVAHTLILSLILLDQLPNSSLANNSLYWLIAGSLLGRARSLVDKKREIDHTETR